MNKLNDFNKRGQSTSKCAPVGKLPCRWLLAAVLAGAPMLAFAQPSEEQDADIIPAEQIKEAPVTALTELEEAPITAQTELEDAPVVPLIEVEEVVVTGSRLARTPGELAGNLVVLDEDFIRSTGEATLERVLRQLPQNLNATAERIGSDLNNVTNFTGASTVNLRGLGSEATLILIDGKRAGYNGFLGGVTDVSTIPLSVVERIEVMLDGASAIYGSDAVGGVVNIITRKDYQGVEVDLNYNWPDGGGYDEWRGTVSGGTTIDGTRVRASYSHAEHSGLDGSRRESTILQRSRFAGPQYDIRFCCLNGEALPILWRLDGDVLTQGEYNALSPEDQARTTPETHAVLPEGFNENSSVDDITQFGPPNWGAETQAGRHILPKNERDNISASIDRDFGERLSAEAHVRYENRKTTYNGGYIGFGGETLGGGNPFNPFGRNVHLYGQRPDMGTRYEETDSDSLNIGIEFEGSFTDNWEWEAGFGFSSEDSDTKQVNNLDGQALRDGLRSDGVTPRTQFVLGETPESCAEKGGQIRFGIYCVLSLPPIPSLNPFGDLSSLITEALLASSTNEQTRFDALVRGNLWSMPAGDVRLLLGYSWHETVLKSQSEFRIGTIDSSPIGDIETFHTEAERANMAIYAETLVPLFDRLTLSLSGRCDSYDTPEVNYRESGAEDAAAEDIADPGNRTTWGAGLVFTPVNDVRLRFNAQTAFVAPQINQILRRTSERISQPFRGLLIELPDGSLSFEDALIREGGNPDLKPETADTLSAGIELNPQALPGLTLKATWNETKFKNRISRLGNFIIDPNNIPSNTMYLADADLWTQERRWINVSSVDRTGVDYEAHNTTSNDYGDFTAQIRHSRTGNYEVILDPATDDPISVVSHTDGSTPIGVVSRSATSAQLIWGYRGIEAGIDVSSRSGTSTTSGGSVTRSYDPPTIVDLRLSYNFAEGGLLSVPGWAEGARLSFIVNNVGNKFGKTQLLNEEGMMLEQSEPDASPQYGRVFNLSLRMSI